MFYIRTCDNILRIIIVAGSQIPRVTYGIYLSVS